LTIGHHPENADYLSSPPVQSQTINHARKPSKAFLAHEFEKKSSN
jgi:hypothetical protein